MRPPPSSSAPPGQGPFVVDALRRLKGMFLEMPGTEWTVSDAARLSGLEISVCRALLDAMRDAGFLTQRADGCYVAGHAPAAGAHRELPRVDESPGNAVPAG
jgi:DNA-binding IclR family transcriptional regulator